MTDKAKPAAAQFATLHDAFRPGARYFSGLDCVVFLKEDCSYRSARVSPPLSLLLAPDKDVVVGVKIKGVRHLTESLLSILGPDLSEDHKVELRALLEMAVISDKFAEKALTEAEILRRKQMSERAKDFLREAGNVKVEVPQHLDLAA